ncbi:MAG: nickel-dependent hydrogenase large subunit [Sulfurimonas sp.]|nr:nickel-dependent hydrogenase large subunit [Sulfurimonas sp.]MDQ7061401.1 nickel-dependent hydrogenase large subunit [Sulfurimonas sp.]
MITKEIIDRIEGEASIHFDMKDEKVDFATVSFPHFRGMEKMLQGKNALDALVITPRVCGICGHAHLMATVRAIEDAYKNAGKEIILSQKAQNLREFTLVMEMIQNHFKWLYLTIIPELTQLASSTRLQTPLKGAFASQIATKALALFAGQWPHSSYMIPGGITSDPTHMELIKAKSFVEELVVFFEKETARTGLDEILDYESCKDFKNIDSDISALEQNLMNLEMHKKGFAYDRFINIGKHRFTSPWKLLGTKPYSIDIKYIDTENSYSPEEKSYAKNALYKDKYYETGPLSRLMAQKIPLIKNIHRRFKDSTYSRVMARVFEIPLLLQHSLKLLSEIQIDEISCAEVEDISKITASGIGVVEAPRGPLIHKVEIEKGIIKKYKIITPTQWNIGSGSKEKPMPAQKAMQGLSKEEALFVFRGFDVCSVCTTH